MALDRLKRKRTERITEWITGGVYAVAVEVEAIIYPDRPDDPHLAPPTVRYLEELEKLAEMGDVEALKKAGAVFVRLNGSDSHASGHVQVSPTTAPLPQST